MVVPVFIIALMATGCDSPSQNNKLASKSSTQRSPIRRFEITQRGAADVAFDTQTGQICRTWAWVPTEKERPPNPSTGLSPQIVWGQDAPTCVVLYRDFPSMSGDVESVPDEQKKK